MRRGTAAVVVVAAVFAGCGGLPLVGDDAPSEPVATAVPDEREAPSPPPGVLSLQVVNPTELGHAHAGVIENRSYVVSANRTVRAANGTTRAHIAAEVDVDEDRSFRARVSTAGPEAPVLLGEPPADAVYWSDGETYLRRLSRDGRTTYVEFDRPDTWVGTWSYWAKTVPFGGRANRPSTFYADAFAAVPARVTGTTTLDGTTVFRVVNGRDRPFSDRAFPGRVESIHDLSMVALVDGDGLVRSFDLRYAGSIDGEPVRVRHTIRYSGVGSTDVDRPPWFDRATGGSTDDGDASGRE